MERDQGLITGQTRHSRLFMDSRDLGSRRAQWRKGILGSRWYSQSRSLEGGERGGGRGRRGGTTDRAPYLKAVAGAFQAGSGVSERMGQGQSCRHRGRVRRPEGEGCEGCGPGALGRLCRAVGRQGSQPSRMEPGGAARGDSVDRQGSSEGGGVGGRGGGNCKCRKGW